MRPKASPSRSSHQNGVGENLYITIEYRVCQEFRPRPFVFQEFVSNAAGIDMRHHMNRMRRMGRILCVLIFSLHSVGGSAYSLPASPLWGDLEAGPYGVGYKTVFAYDLSRPAIAANDSGSVRVPNQRGRQMQIGVWYPAAKASRRSSMRFEEYVVLLAQELDFSPLDRRRREQCIGAYVNEPLSNGASPEKLQALLRMRTGAVRNARPVHGRFPLVVYAHIPPSGNSIMCEFLASHGFVVAAIPWKGTYEYNLDVGLTGVETQIRDMEFVVGHLRSAANVDGNSIAVIGMSFGAISALGFQTRNTQIDAVVSLDGGIGSPFGASVVQRTPYYSLSRVTTPILHLFGPDVPGTDVTYLRRLKYSHRYLVAFPGMRHADFVNQGMLEHFVPGIQGKPSADTKTGFEWVCRYTLHFLNAYLKNDGPSLSFLENPPDTVGVPKGVLSIERLPNLKAPPSVRQLQAMVEDKGIESIVALYAQLRDTDPQPLPQQTFNDLVRWLGAKGDWKSAKVLVDLRLESYATSAWANYAAADVYRRLGDQERAKHLYGEALRLLPGDFDPETDARRLTIFEGSRQNVESTNSQ